MPQPSFLPSESPFNSTLVVGAVVSLFIHVLLWRALNLPPPEITPQSLVIDVALSTVPVIESAPERRQMVAPPEQPPVAEKPVEQARFDSDRDAAVEREMVRRGDPLAGAEVHPERTLPRPGSREQSAPQTESKAIPAPAPQQRRERGGGEKGEQRAPAPKERSLTGAKLTLDSATVAKQFALPAERPQQVKSGEPMQSISAANYRPFSRPSGSGAAFVGAAGSNDYLPSLPDGDITLLNTKANQYAVFVRRVATRVFAQLRTAGWDILRGAEINAARTSTVVRVVLSPSGKILRTSIDTRSGSERFDRVVLNAAQSGTPDPNPPVGALASDGNVHFVFEARSWAEVVPAQNGSFSERRWLLLGTGLE